MGNYLSKSINDIAKVLEVDKKLKQVHNIKNKPKPLNASNETLVFDYYTGLFYTTNTKKKEKQD